MSVQLQNNAKIHTLQTKTYEKNSFKFKKVPFKLARRWQYIWKLSEDYALVYTFNEFVIKYAYELRVK